MTETIILTLVAFATSILSWKLTEVIKLISLIINFLIGYLNLNRDILKPRSSGVFCLLDEY